MRIRPDACHTITFALIVIAIYLCNFERSRTGELYKTYRLYKIAPAPIRWAFGYPHERQALARSAFLCSTPNRAYATVL